MQTLSSLIKQINNDDLKRIRVLGILFNSYIFLSYGIQPNLECMCIQLFHQEYLRTDTKSDFSSSSSYFAFKKSVA